MNEEERLRWEEEDLREAIVIGRKGDTLCVCSRSRVSHLAGVYYKGRENAKRWKAECERYSKGEALKEAHNCHVRRAENQMGRLFLVEEVCARFMFQENV